MIWIMPAPAPAAVASGLTKAFGRFTAVDGIDFRIETGEAFGLLGPNGAGKSTTMKMLGATSRRTGGHLEVLGADPDVQGPSIRARIGVVPQEDRLDLDLTVAKNMAVYGRYFGLPRWYLREKIPELLDFAQLTDKRDVRADDLSGGMKRRLTIARALINEPRLLMLDEPTTGLDPQARHLLWEKLFRLRESGTTLLLTTHYMDEAEQLCDRIVVIDHGRIMAEGSPAALIREHVSREVLELRLDRAVLDEQAALLRERGGFRRVERLPDRLLIHAEDADAALTRSHDLGVPVRSSLVRRASLEDVFLTLTGRSLIE